MFRRNSAAIVFTFLACQRPAEPTQETPPLAPVSVEQMATRGAANVEDNERGLIAASTLSKWIANWEQHRPKGITGDLVVLQRNPATAPSYVVSRSGVRVYHAVELPLLVQQRSNGVVAIGLSPGRGVRVDSFLRRYRIDLTRDFVLLAVGKVEESSLADLARAYLTFRYWGAPDSALGILNGTVDAEIDIALRGDAALEAPIDGTFRMPQLTRNQQALLATLEDARASKNAEASWIDVRPIVEFEGREVSKIPNDDTCLAGPPHCSSVLSGRISGAKHLPLETWIDLTTARFKPQAELDAALTQAGLKQSKSFVFYDAEGASSAVAAFASLAIVGAPTRWYAGGFGEVASLNASHPNAALRTLPESSPWRGENVLEAGGAWGSLEHSVRPLVLAPSAPDASALKREDLEYLKNPPALPAPGAGASDCVNN